MPSSVVIYNDPNIPINCSDDYLVNFIRDNNGNDEYIKTINGIIKNNLKRKINGIFTDLVTNEIIKYKQFYNLVLKIYDNLNSLKNSINITGTNKNLGDYSVLVFKGGNIMKLIVDRQIRYLKKITTSKNLRYYKKIKEIVNKNFKRSDIDLSLLVDYFHEDFKDGITKANLIKSVENFKYWACHLFNSYKVDREFLDNLNKDIDFTKSNKEINKIVQNLIDKISPLFQESNRSFNNRILLYLNDFFSNRVELPTKTDDVILRLKTGELDWSAMDQNLLDENPDDNDYLSAPIVYTKKSNHLETNFFVQYNDKLSFLNTKNADLKGSISQRTSHKLQNEISSFTLIRLLYKVDPKNKKGKYPGLIRGELIDLTINYPDDYFASHIFDNLDKNIESYNIDIFRDSSYFREAFIGYSPSYIVEELGEIIFGVYNENVDIGKVPKVDKRIKRLFILIILEINEKYSKNDVYDSLQQLKLKVSHKSVNYPYLDNTSEIYGPPELSRRSTSELTKGASLFLELSNDISNIEVSKFGVKQSQLSLIVKEILTKYFLPIFNRIYAISSRFTERSQAIEFESKVYSVFSNIINLFYNFYDKSYKSYKSYPRSVSHNPYTGIRYESKVKPKRKDKLKFIKNKKSKSKYRKPDFKKERLFKESR